MGASDPTCTICVYADDQDGSLCSHKWVAMGIVIGMRHERGIETVRVCDSHTEILDVAVQAFEQSEKSYAS